MGNNEIDQEAIDDLAAFDKLPRRLRDWVNQTPIGMDAPTVLELYEKKKDQCWADDDDPVAMTINVLRIYMAQQGVDLTPFGRRK